MIGLGERISSFDKFFVGKILTPRRALHLEGVSVGADRDTQSDHCHIYY
jgi:hypothetical protein